VQQLIDKLLAQTAGPLYLSAKPGFEDLHFVGRGCARLVARYDEHDPKNFGKILRAGISSAMMKCLET
jgi:hypothetical protein